jgi:2-methylisocitrate lyase-like PEP mutase family enzyme
VARRIEAVQYTARENLVAEFVINAVMQWPGTVDEAIVRANQYLDYGATTVTILRRIPTAEIPEAEFLRMIHGIKGRVGVVLQMPSMGSRPCKASDMATAKVARIGFGNQWPYQIRMMFQKGVKLLFSD